MKLTIKYSTGLVEELETSHETLEGFVNEKFGSSYEVFLEHGGTIEVEGAEPAPPPAEPPAPPPAEPPAPPPAEPPAPPPAEPPAPPPAEAPKTRRTRTRGVDAAESETDSEQ